MYCVLDPQRQQHLLHLAGVGLVEGQEALAGELLGDGAAALGQPALAQVGQRGAGDAHDVDAAVRAEPLVLDRQQRLHQVRRDIGQRHVEAPLVEDGERRGVGGVVEHGGLGHLAHAPHVVDAGQPGEQPVDAPLRGGDRGALQHGHKARDDDHGRRESAHAPREAPSAARPSGRSSRAVSITSTFGTPDAPPRPLGGRGTPPRVLRPRPAERSTSH